MCVYVSRACRRWNVIISITAFKKLQKRGGSQPFLSTALTYFVCNSQLRPFKRQYSNISINVGHFFIPQTRYVLKFKQQTQSNVEKERCFKRLDQFTNNEERRECVQNIYGWRKLTFWKIELSLGTNKWSTFVKFNGADKQRR